jgi:hypothetical protein
MSSRDTARQIGLWSYRRCECRVARLRAPRQIEKTVPVRISQEEGLDVGEDTGTPVNLSYDVPFGFTVTLGKVTIDLK